MKHVVKKFGQFVNENGMMDNRMQSRESGRIEGVSELAVFQIEGMFGSGSLELISGEAIPVDFPRDSDNWEANEWHQYVCDIASKNGVDCVYFPEDGVIIKC
jgi:hypothetical protein